MSTPKLTVRFWIFRDDFHPGVVTERLNLHPSMSWKTPIEKITDQMRGKSAGWALMIEDEPTSELEPLIIKLLSDLEPVQHKIHELIQELGAHSEFFTTVDFDDPLVNLDLSFSHQTLSRLASFQCPFKISVGLRNPDNHHETQSTPPVSPSPSFPAAPSPP